MEALVCEMRNARDYEQFARDVVVLFGTCKKLRDLVSELGRDECYSGYMYHSPRWVFEDFCEYKAECYCDQEMCPMVMDDGEQHNNVDE